MDVLKVRNVNTALPFGIELLRNHGVKKPSRNGNVIVAPAPVTTVYTSPMQRVLLDPVRDANPFFHLFESLWMLAGRNDLKYVEQFAGNMRNYSDDGEHLWGAYGWRWRSYFGRDNLNWVIDRLHDDRTDRRAVLQMWDGTNDPQKASTGGKDVPCNLTAHFQLNVYGSLDMTVFCRSNDIVWGAYGANAVHFSYLQEYVAAFVGAPVGRYYQISNNFHAYEDLYNKLLEHYSDRELEDPYKDNLVQRFPLRTLTPKAVWDADLNMFMDEPTAIGFRDAFFRKIAVPMRLAHRAYRNGEVSTAVKHLNSMPIGNDWRVAGLAWVNRRVFAKRKAQDDGVVYE